MPLSLDEIAGLYRTAGVARYGMEAINQRQHALQCALLAEQAGSSPELVAAALLHDLGHLLIDEPLVDKPLADRVLADKPGAARQGRDDLHEFMALPFLHGLFPEAVLAPIRLHVAAKRYLCLVEAGYQNSLSLASQRSLELQGGRFSIDEAASFIALPFAADAVELRRWDDLAKSPDAVTPDWSHYSVILEAVRPASAS